MKNKTIKIFVQNKTKTRVETCSSMDGQEDLLPSQSFIKPIGPESSGDLQIQLKGMLSLLEEHMKATLVSKKKEAEVEPRDRKIVFDLPTPKYSNALTKQELELWVTDLSRQVFSTTFYYYQKGWVNYDQAKIYCSENMISNIIRLDEKFHFTSKQIRIIDKHINDGVTLYLLSKYPMTQTQSVNKTLESLVKEIDNIEALENDIFSYSEDSYGFQYREDGSYNDLIMKLMNDLMSKIDQRDGESKQNQNQTIYGQFYEYMQNFFQKIENRDWMDKGSGVAVITDPSMKKIEDDKYRSRVKGYTSSLIGRKISENVSLFSQAQIKSRHMIIKHPAILRILTKWAQQLWNKFDKKNYFFDRSQNVKTLKSNNVNTCFAWMKIKINEMIQQQKIEIESYLNDLFKNNYDQQAIHLFHSQRDTKFTNVQKIQKASGIFAVNIVSNLHSYILLYLNRLIHGLLKVGKKIYQQQLIGRARWNSPPNLISFKIGDLMRCKVASQQREIQKLFRQLNRISDSEPDTLKIIRVKNRLKEGTNDILINIRFRKVFLCQMQLAINSDHSNFIKCSNKYNHFIYQLRRSIFGPMTQFCSIWRSLDGRSKIYEKMAQSKKKIQNVDFSCITPQKKHNLVVFNSPFVCNMCNMNYSHNNCIWSHQRCRDCFKSICSKCRIHSQNQQTLKDKLFKNHNNVASFSTKLREDEDIPKYGACFLTESKHIVMKLFVKLTIRGKVGLYVQQGERIERLIQLNSRKQIQSFKEKYIIFKLPLFEGSKLIKIGEIEAKNQCQLSQEVKLIYKKKREVISINKEQIDNDTCSRILEGSQQSQQNIRAIQLADNKISNISYICDKFKNLRKLVLSRNKINNIDCISKLYNLEVLNIRDNKITELPSVLFNHPKLTNLNLRNNLFTEIPADIGKLTNLTKMQLNELKLKSLPETFVKLINLNFLDLSKNSLGEVPIQLRSLKKLKHLGLTKNGISEVPTWIQELSNLVHLEFEQNEIINSDFVLQLPINELLFDEQKNGIAKIESRLTNRAASFSLTGNNIQTISDDFFKGAVNLETLNLNKNKLTLLPQSFSCCVNATNINLSNNQLIRLPQKINDLVNLQQLNLGQNKLQNFPMQLTLCQSLYELSLNGNPLTNIPGKFFTNCTKIMRLNLSKTNLRSMPSQISMCKSLRKLVLSETFIQPEQMHWLIDLKYLEEIDLSNMQLQVLPVQLSKIQSLTMLKADHNKLTDIQPAFFDKLNQLIEVDLSSNQLTVVPESFRHCRKIKKIDFSFNNLTEIPPLMCSFQKLQVIKLTNNNISSVVLDKPLPGSLSELYLQHNKIDNISDSLFKELDNLKQLNLENNQLTKIPEFLKNCSKLKEAKLNNNPILFSDKQIAFELFLDFVKIPKGQEEDFVSEDSQSLMVSQVK